MTKQVPYETIKKIKEVEIRHYPEITLAFVESNMDDSGFGSLFNYISGENKSHKKIPMTAPVISTNKSMAFAMPSSYKKDEIPPPASPQVHIKTQPRKTMAALQFSGRASNKDIQKHTNKLLTTLKTQDVAIVGEPMLMRYNSPFTPGFLRRNEIVVEIK